MLPCCLAALLPYWLTALLPYCLTALLPYCLTALLPYCLTGLLADGQGCHRYLPVYSSSHGSAHKKLVC
ncbi:hypothetical protein C3405_00500 [Aeromonas hydrophila]|nr:hypothetical protein C2U40_10940 [Aeromonas sp. ASNIH4]POU42243.1 hypothetical protein C3405_00500 [Aeromonas hydrophila]POV91084.1 hypothetical protein C3395_00800 [Aeromonas sp. ASNIH6]